MTAVAQKGPNLCWDHEDCPRNNCHGELQQQDQRNVTCLSCERVWTHVKTETTHYLQTADSVVVSEKPVTVTESDSTGLVIERTLGRTREGGSCAQCNADYRGQPYADCGYRVLAEVEPGLVELACLCADCHSRATQEGTHE